MHAYSLALMLIFFIKCIFLGSSIYYQFLKQRHPDDKNTIKKVLLYKEQSDFLLNIMMSLLLIYLFNPMFGNTDKVDGETKRLLTIFGFALILTSNWHQFFTRFKLM